MVLNYLKNVEIILGIFQILILQFSTVAAQTKPNINILSINQLDNKLASTAINALKDHLELYPSYGLSVQITEIDINETDATDVLHSICSKYAYSIANKQPPHVIFDTTLSGNASAAVKSFALALGLPTVSASYGQENGLRQWHGIDENTQKYLLHIRPPADLIPDVVRSIVRKTNIRNAAILYDATYVMDHKYKSLLQHNKIRHVFMPVADSYSALADQIEHLVKLDIRNFFILGNSETIRDVLVLVKPEYFNRTFAWYAISQDARPPYHALTNMTIMFLAPLAYKENSPQLAKMRAHFHNDTSLLPQAFYFDLALRTLLAVKNMLQAGAWPANMEYLRCDDFQGNNTPVRNIDLRQSFLQVTEPPSYGYYELVMQPGKPFNGNSYYRFKMFFFVQTDASVHIIIGSWTAGLDSSLVVTNEEALKKYTAVPVYRIVTVVQAPFIMKDKTAPKGYKGFCIDLINEIADIANFEYTIQEVEDGKFGSMNKKGKWNGIVKKLIDKKADIGLGSMFVMAARESAIDFTVPYYDLVGITIMMKVVTTPGSLFKFLMVFETNVWLFIVGSYFSTSFLFWILDRWSPYSYQNNREKYKDDNNKRVFHLKESFWFCLASLTPQGSGDAPKSFSGRVLAVTWWLFGFVTIASYTANLAAFLTVSRLDKPIESLEELAKQYKVLYAPVNGSSAMIYFERMANIEKMFYKIWKGMALNASLSPLERSKLAVWDYPISDRYTKMWEDMKETQLPATLEDAVKRVRNATNTEFALVGDATDIRYLEMTNCDLQVVGEEFSRKPYAIAVQQGSHLKGQFNRAILTLLSKRRLEKLKAKWWKRDKTQAKCPKPEDPSDGISIENLGGVFIIILVGIGMACIAIVIEYCWYKYRKYPRIIDVAEATTPSGTDVTLAEAIILDQTEKEQDKTNAGLRPRFNQNPNNFTSRF